MPVYGTKLYKSKRGEIYLLGQCHVNQFVAINIHTGHRWSEPSRDWMTATKGLEPLTDMKLKAVKKRKEDI